MKIITFLIDSWGHKELKDYLSSLNGVENVLINDESEYLKIGIKYNNELINEHMLLQEIYLFLELNTPSLISFDRHSIKELNNYIIERKEVCCECCFMGTIETLLNKKGIEKVKGNIDYKSNDITINISYDSDLITKEDINKIVDL